MNKLFEKIISYPDAVILELKSIKDEIAAAAHAYKTANDQKQTTPVVHMLSRSQAEINEDERRYQEHKGYQERDLRVNTIYTIVTAVIACATIISVVLSSQSVKVSKESAEATLRQNRLEQRAWIAVAVTIVPVNQPISTKPLANPLESLINAPFSIRVTVKNTGKTPAFHVRTVQEDSSMGVVKGKFPTRDFEYKPEDIHEFGTLMPEASFFSDYGGIMDRKAFDEIADQRRRVIVDGRVEYSDAFGVSHWYNFCDYMTPGGAFAQCPYHNAIDDTTD